MQWAINSGSIFYVVSASVIPSMSRADFSLVQSFGIDKDSISIESAKNILESLLIILFIDDQAGGNL